MKHVTSALVGLLVTSVQLAVSVVRWDHEVTVGDCRIVGSKSLPTASGSAYCSSGCTGTCCMPGVQRQRRQKNMSRISLQRRCRRPSVLASR